MARSEIDAKRSRLLHAAVLAVAGTLIAALALLTLSKQESLRQLLMQPQMLLPPDYDDTAPEFVRLGEQRHVLAFSKTNGFRHRDGIAGVLKGLEQLAANRGWVVFATENAAVFNADSLDQFDAVIINHATGPLFTGAQQLALETYRRAGGRVLTLCTATNAPAKTYSTPAALTHLANQIENKGSDPSVRASQLCVP